MARLPYCRCVTVLLWHVFRFAAITLPRSRMLARYACFFNVISTASLWDLRRLCRQWGERMWAYVRIEPVGSNVARHCAHCIALLLFFSGVCARGRYSDTWPTTSGSITDRPGPMICRLATRNSHSTVGEACFYQVILFISRVKVDNNVGRSQGESNQR